MKKYTEEGVVELFEEYLEWKVKGQYYGKMSHPNFFLKEKGLIKDNLEVGKWYWLDNDKCFLYFYTSKSVTYGFNIAGRWSDTLSECDKISGNEIEATKEEVEEALIKEAKKRGFKEGVVVYSLLRVRKIKVDRFHSFGMSGNSLVRYGGIDGDGMTIIFKDGKWAEIVEEEAKERTIEQLQKELGYKIKIVE